MELIFTIVINVGRNIQNTLIYLLYIGAIMNGYITKKKKRGKVNKIRCSEVNKLKKNWNLKSRESD